MSANNSILYPCLHQVHDQPDHLNDQVPDQSEIDHSEVSDENESEVSDENENEDETGEDHTETVNQDESEHVGLTFGVDDFDEYDSFNLNVSRYEFF